MSYQIEAADAKVRDYCALVGYGTLLLSHSPVHKNYTAVDTQVRIVPPIKLRQVKFYFDDNGDIIAFASWAWVTPEVLNLLEQDNGYLLHISEWAEGEIPFIVDLVAPFGHFEQIKLDIEANLFSGKSVSFSKRVVQ